MIKQMWILINYFLFFFFQVSAVANVNSFTSPSCFSMGGAGSLFSSANTQIKNPAVLDKSRSITTSIVKYPSLINSQSVNINLPNDNTVFSASLKYLSYGAFKGYNQFGEDIGTYRSYETWVDGYLAKQIKPHSVFIGSSICFKSSNFHIEKIKTLSTSLWLIKQFKNKNNAIGFSINYIGLNFSNRKLSTTSPNFILGASKKLKYLPAISYIDFLRYREKTEIFTGICFLYGENIKLLVGSSTRKFGQNTSQNLFRSILGATGFGFVYEKNRISVQYGAYYYGVGLKVDGLNIGIIF